MSVEVGLGLGSNIGDKIARIGEAVRALAASHRFEDLRVSSLYRTAPWGVETQDWFINACAVARTDLAPGELLLLCQGIEASMGRERTIRWGPRIIDVDVLYYNDLVSSDPNLQLPHPELLKRAFVLVPLAELRPQLVVFGQRIADALASLDRSGVQPVSECPPSEFS